MNLTLVSIVSIQTDQFRLSNGVVGGGTATAVSIVSIQTDQFRRLFVFILDTGDSMFQSYQSKQINSDLNLSLVDTILSHVFQSYQSKQINSDSYPRGASRGTALRCRMAEPVFERLK